MEKAKTRPIEKWEERIHDGVISQIEEMGARAYNNQLPRIPPERLSFSERIFWRFGYDKEKEFVM